MTTKLFCGYCGAYLCGESGTSHTGNVHHYYKCVSVKKKRTECHKKSVRKEWIEDLVVSETMKMVMDDEAIEAIVSMLMDLQDRENVNLPLYEQQLRETDTAIQNLLNAIQQGILTKSTKGRLEELEATKEELETKIACEKLAKPKVSAEFMTFWLHRFRKLDVRQKSHRKMLIDTFINAIFLYDDKMVITFNYKEGTTTITLMTSKPHWPIRKQVRIWIAQLHQNPEPLWPGVFFMRCKPQKPGRGQRPRPGTVLWQMSNRFEAHALHKAQEGGLPGGVLLKDAGVLQHMAEHDADLALDDAVGFLRRHGGAVLGDQLVDPVGVHGQRRAFLAAGVGALPGQDLGNLRALVF